MTFQSDLEFGNNYELLYTKIKNLHEPVISEGKFSAYDIISDNVKYEVKADRLAFKTNNLCIEYECNKKPSGISTTEADFYCYFVLKNNKEYDLYEIPVNVLKDEIQRKTYKRSMKGGTNYKSSFYLFDKNLFINYLYK